MVEGELYRHIYNGKMFWTISAGNLKLEKLYSSSINILKTWNDVNISAEIWKIKNYFR